MNHKCGVLVVKHLVKEGKAGVAFAFQNTSLAEARVHQEAERKWHVAFAGKVTDGLGTSVLFQDEVVLRQVADDLSVLIAHGCGNVDHLDLDRNVRLGARGLSLTGLG